jgi:hypothetical protein
MSAMRILARFGAYLITLLLATVWAVSGIDSLARPLLDLGRPLIGDVVLASAGTLALSPAAIFTFAKFLAGLKIMIGGLLFTAIVGAIYEKVRFGKTDDSLLDVALFTAALASAASALPGLLYGGELLLSVVGELMLCVIASLLAIYGRGYLFTHEQPAVTRPEPVIVSA